MDSVPPTLQALTERMDQTAAESGCGWVARLIEAEGPVIQRLLWRILGREQDVLDAYQDTFCKLASLPQRPNLRSAKAYAYRTAANIAIEMIRSRTRRQAHWPRIAVEGSSCTIKDRHEGESEGNVERLKEGLAILPPHLRNVVVLRDLCRMSYEEVGRKLGIDSATARVYRRHAVVKLAVLLDGRVDL